MTSSPVAHWRTGRTKGLLIRNHVARRSENTPDRSDWNDAVAMADADADPAASSFARRTSPENAH